MLYQLVFLPAMGCESRGTLALDDVECDVEDKRYLAQAFCSASFMSVSDV